MTTSFNVRGATSIQSSLGPLYLQLSNIPPAVSTLYTEWLTTTDLINASVLIFTQKILDDGRTVHYIRCGSKYINNVLIGGFPYLVLRNQPQYWYLTTNNAVVPTQSTVDLLEYVPFYIVNNAGNAWSIYNNGQMNIVSLAPLATVNKLVSLYIQEQTQPIVYASRLIAGPATLSPALSGASVYTVDGGNVTINGFDIGVDGQYLTVYALNGWVITLANLSGAVSIEQQIVTPTGADVVSPPGGTFELLYDTTVSKWIVLTQMAAAGGSMVSLANGTAAAPSLSFAADTNTGIYRQVADVDILRFTNGGADSFRTSPGAFLPAGDLTKDLGAVAERYSVVYCGTVSSGASDLVLNGNAAVIPDADNTKTLGLVGTRWLTVFTPTVSNSGDLTLSSGGSVIPQADNFRDLGRIATRWQKVFTLAMDAGASDLTLIGNTAVIPDADNTKDLGLVGTRWRNLYTTGINAGAADLTLTGNAAVKPTVDNSITCGAALFRWADVYTLGINSGASVLTLTATTRIVPSGDTTLHLGSSALRFNTVNCIALDADVSDITVGVGVAMKPSVDSAKTLGTAALRWNAIYANNFYPAGFAVNAFLENGTLMPALQTTNTDITATYTTQTATWYRVGNLVTVVGDIVWNTLTAGTGDLILITSTPASFPPGFANGTPGSVMYNGITIASGTLGIIATTTTGRCDFATVSDAGGAGTVAIGSVAGTGRIRYTLNYFTVSIS